jgi:hypothetical protein
VAKFSKGQSGNPGGRPKELEGFKALARTHATAGMRVLLEIMKDKKASSIARVSAVRELFDRGFGRPEVAVEHSGSIDTGLAALLAEIDAMPRGLPAKDDLDGARRLPIAGLPTAHGAAVGDAERAGEGLSGQAETLARGADLVGGHSGSIPISRASSSQASMVARSVRVSMR